MKRRIVMKQCLRTAGIIVVTLLLGGLAGPARAGGTVLSERAKALVAGKGTDVLVLEVHGFRNLQSNRLSVPYNPMLYDVDGSAITLDSLKIPCEAFIEYRAAQGDTPQLFRLEVLGYAKNANSYYTELKPKNPPLPK